MCGWPYAISTTASAPATAVPSRSSAPKSGVNPAYLGHLFKEETGNFFNSYLTQCRINRSVVLLQKPGSKIKDVASQVGFASTSYFVRCFRESKGVSPARFRLGRED